MPAVYATLEIEAAGVRFGTGTAENVFVPQPTTRTEPWLRMAMNVAGEPVSAPELAQLAALWRDLASAAGAFVDPAAGLRAMLQKARGAHEETRYFVRPRPHDWLEVAPAGGRELEQAWREMSPAGEPRPVLVEFAGGTGNRAPDNALASLKATLACVSVTPPPDRATTLVAAAVVRHRAHWDATLDRAHKERWPDSGAVGRALGSRSLAAGRQRAARLRERGELLGVWVPNDRAFYHPPFQFLADGRPHPRLPDLLASFPSPDDDAWGWDRLTWLAAPRAELSERRLADPSDVPASDLSDAPRSPEAMFQQYPEAVTALARSDAAHETQENRIQDHHEGAASCLD